jgi:NADH-quinone oxidoreductase subunit G
MTEKTVRLTIDDTSVEAREGKNLLDLLNERGKGIPHFCYHPGLSVVASCRQCQVEVAGPGHAPRRITASCRLTAVEGLVVWTATPAAREARRAVLEFLLRNHPLDCPICDKAGECPLQNYTYQEGQSASRFEGEKLRMRKRVDLGPVITLDEERCVLCSRCVRFFEEVTGEAQLGVLSRGLSSMVGTPGDRPLAGDYQGNLADICPVGALTLKKFRSVARIWNLRTTPSTCPLCSRGCATLVDVHRGKVVRIRPRHDPQVNGHWMCDVGRFGFDDLNAKGRLAAILVRDPSGVRERGFERGVEEAAALFREWGEGLLLLGSPFLTNEEGAALRSLAGALGVPTRFLAPALEEGDRILRTGDLCPNRRGLADAGLEPLPADALETALASATGVLLAGERVLDFVLPGALSALSRGSPPAILLDRFPADWPRIAIPARSWTEKSGTFTNVDGHRRPLAPALAPPRGVRPETEVLEALRRRIEGGRPEEPVAASGERA